MTEVLATYFLPEFLHLLPVACHPERAWIEQESDAWLSERAHSLFRDEAHSQKHIGYHVPWWLCLCYPHAAIARIIEIANFTHAITLYDDLYSVLAGELVHADLVGNASSRGKVKVAQLKGMLEGKCPDDPYIHLIDEAWQSIQRGMTGQQRDRFLAHLDATIDALVTEAELRKEDRLLDLEGYLHLKAILDWSKIYILFTEYALGIELPHELLTDPRFTDLSTAFSEHMVLVNDLLSYPMELCDGDVLINSITQLTRGKGISLQEAVDAVVARVEHAESRFVALCDELREARVGQQAEVGIYLSELGYLLSGSVHFQRFCSRYRWEYGSWDDLPSGHVVISTSGVYVVASSPYTHANGMIL